ncbi:MAG TPA: addiction module protein [Candidatus Saccharimonadales bacterium]|nr:addiction module protein [Candidatus Saccharimonadales bacterium]
MPLTLEQIVEEARHWSPEKVCELVDRLIGELHPPAADNDDAWKQEARRRLAEIENGTVRPVDGDEVSARVRRIVSLSDEQLCDQSAQEGAAMLDRMEDEDASRRF